MRLSSTLLPLLAVVASAAELGIEKTHEVEGGCKRRTAAGDTVHMHYRGTLAADGTQFDASYDRGRPLTFKLGAGQVIKG